MASFKMEEQSVRDLRAAYLRWVFHTQLLSSGPRGTVGCPAAGPHGPTCPARTGKRKESKCSFSTLLDLILLRDFKYINNNLQYQDQILHLFTSIQVIELKYIMYWTKRSVQPKSSPIQLMQSRRTSSQLLLESIHSWIQESEEQRKKENNKSIWKAKHFLEEFTKKIILRKPTVTEAQMLTCYSPAHV